MEKYSIIKYENVFSVITDTFKSLHHIKILDFDISNKFIVFAASSGGLYVFKHSPCNLIKFIPSMEGPTLHVKISSDENHLALANSKGLVVILENFFVDFTVRPHVQSDHEGDIVMAINWHGNELYSGDNSGKVSVFTLAKTYFQCSSAVLLNLDSAIVQLDNFQKYFIVSTKSRSYLCDGEKGYYKQIGKKIRNDERGACFCKHSLNEPILPFTTSKEQFQMVSKDSQEFLSGVESSSKIYCARPRGRLWEANFETSVVKTYNFRNLPQNNADVLIIDNIQDTKLRTNESDKKADGLNFKNIYTVCNRFILTYSSNSLHIVDLCKGTLVFSKNDYQNILGVRVLNNSIFIWKSHFKMDMLSLQNLEELIVSTLLNKQYFLCSEICLHFKNYLVDYGKKSARLRLLIILKNKLAGNEEVIKELTPIFSALESGYKNAPPKKTPERGIVTIENRYANIEEENPFFACNISEENTVKINDDNEDVENNKIYCIYRQYNLNKLHPNAELTEYQNLIDNMNMDELLLLMEDFQKIIQDIDSDSTKWIQIQLLKAASMKLLEIKTVQPKTLTFLTDAFLKINSSKNLRCKCLFPLPKAHEVDMKYIELGIQLYNLLDNKQYYLNNHPYFYKQHLKQITSLNFMSLCLLVQFNDIRLLTEKGKQFTYDTWEEAVKVFIQLKQGRCLNCSETIESKNVWSWTDLGLVMIKFIGPINTIRILKRYSADINNGELSAIFFNSCIMAKAYEDYPLIIDAVEHFRQNNQLKTVMEKYLEKQYLDKTSDKGKKLVEGSQKCSYCDLPLNGPILNQYRKCICGNKIHFLCFISNDKLCNTCLS